MSEEIQIIKNVIRNNLKEIICFLLFLILVLGNIIFGVLYFKELKNCENAKLMINNQQTNEKVINFSKLFISKVLKAKSEVAFEERLKLENAVRELGDKEILDQWEKFVSSKTELDAQQNVKDLLEILVNKINIVSK